MKRKNILKFVSLLGIGSFVMLAAASCTTPVNPTPNPTPNPQPKPDPMPNPDGGMMGGNTNPGNGGGTDNAAQQLADAKAALTTLLNTESEKVGLYSDYANIQDTLVKAYTAAKEISDKSDATLQEVNNAKTKLETAITNAANSKTSFDEKNPELIKAYYALKETLKNEKSNLDSVMAAEFAAIKNNLDSLYQTAKTLVEGTLQPKMGNSPQVEVVNQANTNISNAVSKLETWKANANTLATGFVKEVLVKNKLTGIDTTNNQEQPGNYSFVGYSVDVTTGSNNARPNWSFAKRIVWTNTGGNNLPLDNESQNSVPLTDVSWIYSLSGTNAKYTLTFDYYGASSNGYLYFPYKLVKKEDKVALQYSLNGTAPKAIEFKPAATKEITTTQSGSSDASSASSPGSTGQQKQSAPAAAPAGQQSPEAASETNQQGSSSAAKTMSETTTMNEAPTVDSINVAKITLTDLKLGQNTIEFSVPTGDSTKVAPMIGNMYLSSNPNNFDKVYNDIFGNSVAENNAVTVDLLKGYGLAASYREYIRAFTYLNKETQVSENATMKSPTVYLIGLIGGNEPRTDADSVPKNITTPKETGDKRTFIIYVNAPEAGNYSISGSYLTKDNRDLRFSTSDNNAVEINLKGKGDWNTLATFDTANNTNITNGTTGNTGMQTANKTFSLNKGLNKVIIRGTNNKDTPYIGNLVFTLSTSMPASNSNTASEAETSGSPSSNGVQVAA
ncbi:VlhA.1.07 variable lipoprotein family protein [Mycoplasmoides gallisepticum str. R(low)]|uniref:VlhA.1.07 variable lipoprotein family protein n=2 Tax=Mycoplasmoides gallisepticum TaxID=2096 RepID=Q7NB51_MYCGA|nr:FIVAR domain-containing protein [Mycoplasmoides gallisepticum]AAP56779.1 VlhA.1.07 variable lipoprotein family protein [Mycoplasmoides gallisepticum str. R(low)]ADC30634.1 VlhA.1.07 variable lipoprotein family protein [Mycoplasmoides gallisepticum str. R(high)]